QEKKRKRKTKTSPPRPERKRKKEKAIPPDRGRGPRRNFVQYRSDHRVVRFRGHGRVQWLPYQRHANSRDLPWPGRVLPAKFERNGRFAISISFFLPLLFFLPLSENRGYPMTFGRVV